jgi:hypothetical protein
MTPALDFVGSIACVFSIPSSRHKTRYHSEPSTPSTKGWVFVLNCPMPEALESELMDVRHTSFELEMDWTVGVGEEQAHFVDRVSLFPRQLELVKEVSQWFAVLTIH